MAWRIALCLIIGYLCGSISFGYIIGRIKKVDIRKYGSGNLGTTNAIRTLGTKLGLLTFLGDLLKCMIPILILKYVFFRELDERPFYCLCTGLGAVLGHNFPFYLHFKGGKGIAVMSATIMTFDYRIAVIGAIVFFSVLLITKYVSLSSLLLSLEFFITTVIFFWGNYKLILLSAIFTSLAFYSHRTNIVRLIHGNENKIGKKVSTAVSSVDQKESSNNDTAS